LTVEGPLALAEAHKIKKALIALGE
jgi:hypothetical protein